MPRSSTSPRHRVAMTDTKQTLEDQLSSPGAAQAPGEAAPEVRRAGAVRSGGRRARGAA